MVFAFRENVSYIPSMFIRQVKKKNSKSGKTFFQYQLVQTSRIDGKVKQHAILYLGSEPLLEDKEKRNMLLETLQAKLFGQSMIFADAYPDEILELANTYHEKFRIKYRDLPASEVLSVPPTKQHARMERIDVSALEIEDVRTFGGEHLCAQFLEKLQLASCLTSLGFSQKDSDLAHISIIGRALFASPESTTAAYLRDNSELQRFYGHEHRQVSHCTLYRIADKLYENKARIDTFLYRRVTDLFSITDTLVIYDLSNTYFEGRKDHSAIAQYGRSKEKRNDCKQVVFTGVINAQGFIRYSRIYEGNTPDARTLADMIADLKVHSDDVTDHVVVMDAGFATEDNLAFLTREKLKYVCVARTRLKEFLPDPEMRMHRIQDNRGNAIELQMCTPQGYPDTWMYVQSDQKRVKEQSMSDKLIARFEEELRGLAAGLIKKGTTKKTEKVWERIGRIKQKYRLVSGRYTIEIQSEDGTAKTMTWKKSEKGAESEQQHGMYFIRTNIEGAREQQIWEIYNTIREVESTFRCLKHDLLLRPVYHQKDERIEAHIYLAILAYQLVNTIRYMLKKHGIHHEWKHIVRIMNTQTIQSILCNTETKKFSLRKPSKPIKEVLKIYKATETRSMVPDRKKYVVYH